MGDERNSHSLAEPSLDHVDHSQDNDGQSKNRKGADCASHLVTGDLFFFPLAQRPRFVKSVGDWLIDQKQNARIDQAP